MITTSASTEYRNFNCIEDHIDAALNLLDTGIFCTVQQTLAIHKSYIPENSTNNETSMCEVRTVREKNGVRRSKNTQNMIVYKLMIN